jgi:ankyrin repeat protein
VKRPPLLTFIRLIIAGDIQAVSRHLARFPSLATTASSVGATRCASTPFFFKPISHYLYADDTPLHMAAAAFSLPMVKLLLRHGADVDARNRRGAQPLHYAADAHLCSPTSQAAVIAHLISKGANPNSLDKSGVSPLHRAVRTRSFPAVRALLNAGANPRLPNKSGSTPLHLAVQTTGASNSGSPHARRQQAAIIKLLLEYGAKPTDPDAKGKTVYNAATSPWIRKLLIETSTR